MASFDLTAGVRRAAQLFPHQVATLDGDRRRTWSQVARRCDQQAERLQSVGLSPGDRIAFIGANSDTYFEALIAALRVGLVVVPLNKWWSPQELRFALEDSQAAAVLADRAYGQVMAPLCRAAGARLLALDGPAEGAEFELCAHSSPQPPQAERPWPAGDAAGIFYTGGTTGAPKGVAISSANLWSGAMIVANAAGLSSRSLYLHAAPMFHMADLAFSFAVTLLGGAHAFLPAFDPAALITAVRVWRVTHLVLVPTMVGRLLDHPDWDPAAFASLEHLIYGAAPMPAALIERLSAALPHVKLIQAYGQTELAPVATILGAEDHRAPSRPEILRSAGRAAPGVDVEVVGENLTPCAPRIVGQIRARGPNAMSGYWRREAETAATLVDGWVLTGDLGFLDEEGFLYVVDRAKDMIISGGENVYSAEVENALAAHPAVVECAVVAAPDPDLGERVHAIVALRPDRPVEASELVDHCRARIASYKCPRSFDLRTEPLPKSAAGKILKKDLRAALSIPPVQVS